MNPKKIIALVLITIFIIVSPVFDNKAFADGENNLINLSGSIYYNNTIERFENNILYIVVNKDATLKASIDIKLSDKAKDKQTIDNVFLIAQITKKGEDIRREYIDIKSDDLRGKT